MSIYTEFCCDEMADVFEDGVIDFDQDHPGNTRNLYITGKYKEGDGTPNSNGHDYFKIKFCPFCGCRLS